MSEQQGIRGVILVTTWKDWSVINTCVRERAYKVVGLSAVKFVILPSKASRFVMIKTCTENAPFF